MQPQFARSSIRSKRLLVSFILVLCLSQGSSASDASWESVDGIEVESVHATPAKLGETSVVRFRIVNSTIGRITLTEIRSQIAQSGAIVMHDPISGPRAVRSVTIGRDDELGFDDSLIWVELRGLRREAVEGQYIPLELIFMHSAVSSEARVQRNADFGDAASF